jgi:arylsulfate sulfotransferase
MNRPQSDSRILFIHSLLIAILMAGVFLGGFIYKRNSIENRKVIENQNTVENQKTIENQKAISTGLEQLSRQMTVDEKIRAELVTGSHSFERPLIVLDPYGVSPLTAVILFETGRPCRISISVKGKDASCSLDFAFDGYRTRHLIPVYGLYADAENEITITAKDIIGGIRNNHLKIRTDKLHPKIEKIRVDILKSDKAYSQSGFTFLYAHAPKFAFDSNGDFRWILDFPTLSSTLYNYTGHLIVATGSTLYGDVLLYETDLLGRIYSISSTPYGVHHDIEEIRNGKLLVTGSDAGATIEDLIYELDPSTGMIGAILDFKGILDPERPSMYRSDQDWLHLNAVTWSESDNSIIVSARHQSAVVKLGYPDGKIKWILGNHDNWLPEYAKYLLIPKGRHFEWQYAQHSPIILPDQDNNPDTLDIIVFDNHSFMDKQELKATPELRYSRLVQYRIDEKAKTVEQLWEFGKERGNELFSDARGSAEYLPNGNILGFFSHNLGHRAGYSRIIELLHATRKVVFDAIVYSKDHDSLIDYRAARRELYSKSDNDLYKLESCREHISQNVRQHVLKR